MWMCRHTGLEMRDVTENDEAINGSLIVRSFNITSVRRLNSLTNQRDEVVEDSRQNQMLRTAAMISATQLRPIGI